MINKIRQIGRKHNTVIVKDEQMCIEIWQEAQKELFEQGCNGCGSLDILKAGTCPHCGESTNQEGNNE